VLILFTTKQRFTEELRDWADKTYHSTAMDAAKIAKMAEAGKLLIGHFSTRYDDDKPFVDEARTIFPNTEAAADGTSYPI
jgi:ribonuclease Z